MNNMENNNYKKKKRALSPAILIAAAVSVLLAIVLIVLLFFMIGNGDTGGEISQVSTSSSEISSSSEVSYESESSSDAASVNNSTSSQIVEVGGYTLDANYERLILVNGSNPLPQDYDYTGNLTTIDKKYLNGELTQIDKDMFPYLMALVNSAWEDGVKVYIRSPFRSYETQKMLFDNKVQRVIAAGTPADKAEDEAATAVARPGTSEHHTGLAVDFNTASNYFEGTEMDIWLREHAEDFGFILRYPKESQDITGVIYEPWHYRFVGINVAKEINQLGITFEEYIELKNK